MNEVIILHHFREKKWLHFAQPHEIVCANTLSDVRPALKRIEQMIQSGYFAAGFLSYEAAPAFDAAFTNLPSSDFPLLWFGVFGAPDVFTLPKPRTIASLNWDIDTNKEDYFQSIREIKKQIARGETYQVNFTIRQRAEFSGDPFDLFLQFADDAPYGAFVNLDDYAICSASPELFFERSGDQIISRPMKGTAPRGRTTAEDAAIRDALFHSEKNRAENAMIVDMLRNDIGRIAESGSVAVSDVFRIEKYPTVWQMTSTVQAKTTATITEIFDALFPCASITGAPKISTMKIITALERSPRNIYTGCVGFIAPNGDTQFNVAIRTALIDKRQNHIEYGIGGGIVWDSSPEEEYAECQFKARVITQSAQPRNFSLIETMLWEPGKGYFLRDYHLKRLADSAAFFDFSCDIVAIREALVRYAKYFSQKPYKVRLLLPKNGGLHSEHVPISLSPVKKPLRIHLAKNPVDSGDKFLFHKTTRRQVYQRARADFPDADEVILWNERGEITEGCVHNIVVKMDGEWVTPPLECGLLNGVYRQFLLDEGKISERVISVEMLKAARKIALINSVRKWQPAKLIS